MTRLYQPKLKEEHVVIELMQRLAYAQIRVWRIKERIPIFRGGRKFFQGGTSTPGVPDLVGYIPAGFQKSTTPARPLFIEVKRPGGRRRPAQLAFIIGAKAEGAIAFFADSWQSVKDEMKVYGIGLP